MTEIPKESHRASARSFPVPPDATRAAHWSDMERRKRGAADPTAALQPSNSKKLAALAAERPTAAELLAAGDIIEKMRSADFQPPILQPGCNYKPSVAALGLALYFGQKFGSESVAKRTFGVGKGTDVTPTWVEDWLPRFFEHDPEARAEAERTFAQQAVIELPEDVHMPAERQRPESMDSDDWNSKWWIRGFKAARIENEEQVSKLAQEQAQAQVDAAQKRCAAAEKKAAAAEQRWEEADQRMSAMTDVLVQSMQALTEVSHRLRPNVSRAVRAEARADWADARAEQAEERVTFLRETLAFHTYQKSETWDSVKQAFASDGEQLGDEAIEAQIETEWVEQANVQFLQDSLCALRRFIGERRAVYDQLNATLDQEWQSAW